MISEILEITLSLLQGKSGLGIFGVVAIYWLSGQSHDKSREEVIFVWLNEIRSIFASLGSLSGQTFLIIVIQTMSGLARFGRNITGSIDININLNFNTRPKHILALLIALGIGGFGFTSGLPF